MTKVIKVSDEIAKDIQFKDSKYQGLKEVLQGLIESHLINTDTDFLESPVVIKLQSQIANAKKDWDDAKNAMAIKYITPDIAKKAISWELNYGTNELTITME